MKELGSSSMLLKYLGLEVSLSEVKEGVVVSLSVGSGSFQRFRRIVDVCYEKIHTLLPYNNRYDIDFLDAEPVRVLPVKSIQNEEWLFKIDVVGEVCSGKTAFVNRFAHDIYREVFKASIGVDFKTKTLWFGGGVCKLQVWDFAGTRGGDEMTHIYMRDTQGIILTVDLRRPQGYRETYERILRDSAFPNIPILMVGLKSDISRPEDVTTFRKIADKLNMPCMLASAKTGENVNAAFELLLKMMLTQKIPGYRMRLRIRKATLDWFELPRFYGELNQLLVEDVSIAPLVKDYDFKQGLYEATIQDFNENEDEKGLCKFYIKNYTNDDDFIRNDAIKNVELFKKVSPVLVERIIACFYKDFQAENGGVRAEAIHGLRVLEKLHSEFIKKICCTKFNRFEFTSNYLLKSAIEKIKVYTKPELVMICISAISSVHRDCFAILKEMGEVQVCEDISQRVLQAFDEFVKHPYAIDISVFHSRFGMPGK